ncbi:MAG: CRISPR-associated protein Cas4 [Legionellales bacterium]|nr:CRISPR-associated protein Cas4 [Legionellales bacterium]
MLINEDNYLPISALQHYAFCPRQCALINIEQAWAENFWTAEGRLLHERVDGGEAEQRGYFRTERSVAVISHRLKINGKLDLLEITGRHPKKYFPVEYKRGKPKIENWDKVQLCAQVFCLEEMRNIEINEAAIWYWKTRKREYMIIDQSLRDLTEKIIIDTHEMIESGITPKPTFSKRCLSCSLIDLCEPKIIQNDQSKNYINGIFKV